ASVLNLLLVPRFGLIGAAIATATALSAAAIVNAVVARRRLGLDISIVSLLRRR
ncbi:MAG: Polysaccharide biosynthesis C-terminal domain, partial [Pseudomonadota bacterium]